MMAPIAVRQAFHGVSLQIYQSELVQVDPWVWLWMSCPTTQSSVSSCIAELWLDSITKIIRETVYVMI
jgi:hypothetical protein